MAGKDRDSQDTDKTDAGSELWAQATRDVKKLDRNVAQVPPAKRPGRIRVREHYAAPAQPSQADMRKALNSGGTDRKTETRLRKGEIEIDRSLDLHGLTVPQARARLMQFVLESASTGLRCLLVVTGKGQDRDHDGEWYEGRGSGAIRREFRFWLEDASVRPFILSVAQAHARHGGGGAWYIYLRKIRPR